MEKKLLKLLLNKANYSSVRSLLDVKDFSPLSKDILTKIDEYFSVDDNAEYVDPDVLIKNLELSLTPKYKDMATELIHNVIEEDISEENLINLVVNQKQASIGTELSSRLLNNPNDKEKIDKLINEYITVKEQVSEIVEQKQLFNNVSVAEAFEKLDIKNRIPFYPKVLNEKLKGGPIRGQNILIYGRPEIGKTLFIINLIGGFLHHGFRVLYVGNEDPCSAIIPRIITRLTETTVENVQADLEKAQHIISKRGYDNLYLEDTSPGTWDYINKRIEEIHPDIVIVDQIRHIYCGNMSKVEQMERVTIQARNAAKTYNILTIGITQAGDSAEDKLVLEMNDVDFSNTGMQGAVDVMIGIGANEDFKASNRRMISLPKNKVGADHSFFPVQYNIPINKVEGL